MVYSPPILLIQNINTALALAKQETDSLAYPSKKIFRRTLINNLAILCKGKHLNYSAVDARYYKHYQRVLGVKDSYLVTVPGDVKDHILSVQKRGNTKQVRKALQGFFMKVRAVGGWKARIRQRDLGELTGYSREWTSKTLKGAWMRVVPVFKRTRATGSLVRTEWHSTKRYGGCYIPLEGSDQKGEYYFQNGNPLVKVFPLIPLSRGKNRPFVLSIRNTSHLGYLLRGESQYEGDNPYPEPPGWGEDTPLKLGTVREYPLKSEF